jgi:putative addiction module killer protein
VAVAPRRSNSKGTSRSAHRTTGCRYAGDHRFLGAALLELRDDFGPGYRIYYMHRGEQLIILLVGGDKASQARDILRARQMVEQLDSRP